MMQDIADFTKENPSQIEFEKFSVDLEENLVMENLLSVHGINDLLKITFKQALNFIRIQSISKNRQLILPVTGFHLTIDTRLLDKGSNTIEVFFEDSETASPFKINLKSEV